MEKSIVEFNEDICVNKQGYSSKVIRLLRENSHPALIKGFVPSLIITHFCHVQLISLGVVLLFEGKWGRSGSEGEGRLEEWRKGKLYYECIV